MTTTAPRVGSSRATPKTTVFSRGLALLDALATPHGIDRYLELVNPMLAVRELRAEITKVERTTSDTVTLQLRPTRVWKGFVAGQFVALTVLIDGVRRTRCYSPANSQHHTDGRIELTIKADPSGIVSPWLVENARPGMIVGLSQADGSFVLPDERPQKLLFISGGSGITPVLSMLRTLIDEGYTGDVTFVHYAYTREDVPGLQYLQHLVDGWDNVHLVLGFTDVEGGDLSGFFGSHHLEAVAPWHAEAATYLCGPAGLMKSVREHYASVGLLENLHVEEFTPAITVIPGEAVGEITFEKSNISAANTGETLLEQAEKAGLHPEYGCRMGICFSCTQIKKSGCVRNVISGDTSDDPDEQIQLCISVPLGDISLEI
ncbi:ferredoxin reductase [Jatrophihabitans sp. GAS493]|uniref:ferredoxin reductase n=1 Tax=Jatrophihabitans sp. GAS493 TaxID=1907575 RepID=UPI001F52E9B7|nr:ferredoxin reductase [Jatrophihabitans sp. GAS493]